MERKQMWQVTNVASVDGVSTRATHGCDNAMHQSMLMILLLWQIPHEISRLGKLFEQSGR